MKHIKLNLIGLTTAVLLAAGFFLFSSFSTDEKVNTYNFPETYKITIPKIPAQIDFCGEKVPLDNFDVFERLDRELTSNTYWHSNMLTSFKNSGRWFPVIEPILKKNGIPADFKYLAIIESNLTNAVSPKGAVGFWQFIESTAVKYNLEVNDQVDERYNVEKSTEAACKYLKDAYNKFGSWTLAAASYNMGMSGVSNQLSRQRVDNYFNLFLNEETSRYIFRTLAVKEIMSNPAKYGFGVNPEEFYQPIPTKEVQVTSSIPDLISYAETLGVNYKILKMLNPWLRDSKLTLSKKDWYTVKIPEEGVYKIYTKEDLIPKN
ncbi:MAG: lytic transglycosylase domain-containing protein [Ignavibacteria bacterium]|nr:lytic transglycosylase domain-containing protein [Ignavibacteria bacterium]